MLQHLEDMLEGLQESPQEGRRLPDWAMDHQWRARRTRARILEAARQLMDERPPEGIAVQDLARAAGISVGAFYARFPSKDAVIELLGVVVYEEIERMFALALGPELGEGPPARAAVRSYVATRVLATRRNRAILQALRSVAHGAELPEPVRAVERAIHARMRARLLPHLAPATDQGDVDRLGMALLVVDSAAAAAVLSEGVGTDGPPPDDGLLVRELSLVLERYLVLGDDRRAGGPGQPSLA